MSLYRQFIWTYVPLGECYSPEKKPTTTLIDLIEYIKAKFPSLPLQVDYINRNQLTHQAITCVDPENIFPVSQGEIGRLGGVGSKVNFPENNHVNLINQNFFYFFLWGGGGYGLPLTLPQIPPCIRSKQYKSMAVECFLAVK